MVELAFSFFVPASCMPHDIVTTARKVREIPIFIVTAIVTSRLRHDQILDEIKSIDEKFHLDIA